MLIYDSLNMSEFVLCLLPDKTEIHYFNLEWSIHYTLKTIIVLSGEEITNLSNAITGDSGNWQRQTRCQV